MQTIASLYRQLRSMGEERPIADRLLDALGATFQVSDTDVARIPCTGAAIVTVNHPFGFLDSAVLVTLLGRIRPDVRVLANPRLTAVRELHDVIIPANGLGLRRSLEHLAAGGLLLVFPSGTVSHFRWKDRAVSDPEWNPAVARMVAIAARKGTRVAVIPAYIEGRNSMLFQFAGLIHPALRTALLGHELFNKRGCRVKVRIGAAIASEKLLAIPSAREQADYLRWRTYLLAGGGARPRMAAAKSEPIADGSPCVALLAEEIRALPAESMLGRSGDLEVYLASAGEIPNILRELGRLREITFRAAGEGTGKPLDLDEFDAHYLHLFVWHARRQELVGAYRLAGTDTVRRRFGIRGLYTATLFRYGDPFLDRLGPALELGRSFIRQEYQKGFAPLLLLWKGIGAYLARHPRYRILFGPVSISNQYEAASRELMVAYLERYERLSGWAGLVETRRAPTDRCLRGASRPVFPNSGVDMEDLAEMVCDIEQKPAGVPVLLRQYLKLGGKLLGFNVDPKFANALDGLILVDLARTDSKLLERYLGKDATFIWNTAKHSSLPVGHCG